MSSLTPRDAERIERALDDRLSEEEGEAFKADIVRDPVLRAAYAERRWLHALLRAERDRLPQLLADASDAEAPAPARTRANPAVFASLALAAAACAVLGFTLFRPHRAPASPQPHAVATLVQAANTKWAGSTLPTAENSPLGAGTLALVEGIATLKFASGASVTLEAPTTLEIVDAMNCRLIEGSVTAEVPLAAHGFAVDTPDLRVVDLGTRFGVTAGSAGNSYVFVFEGEVRLTDAAGTELRRLTAGKAYHRASGPTTGNLEPRRFEPEPPIDGWKAITTAYGRGKDAYVRRDVTNAAGAEPFIMVKHSELELSRRNERRGFITFDLAGIDARTVTEAELVLDPEPSGLGFSAMVPDSRFAIYGVTDESLDAWSESTVTWNSAGAALIDETPPADHARKLAEFAIPRGGSGNPLTIRGDGIAAFLRADTNGLATFLIVRETGESDPSGLVHAFASKEHPTARPPTLRVR